MPEHPIAQDSWKQQAGTAAVQFIEEGMVIGLGTGSTANFMLYALAQRIQQGLHIVGAVSSSQATQNLASRLGIPLTDLDTHPELDLYIDGADEIDPHLNLLKGAGGALLREKIVASSARRFIVIGDITKRVDSLLTHFPLPVEVVPFALTPVRKRLEKLGAIVQVRQLAGRPFITDNSNLIVDCTFPHGISDPQALNAQICGIVGTVETGLFLGMAERALIGGPDGVTVLTPVP
jgi:ribose 5-phosphate isomerase A